MTSRPMEVGLGAKRTGVARIVWSSKMNKMGTTRTENRIEHRPFGRKSGNNIYLAWECMGMCKYGPFHTLPHMYTS